MTPQQHALVKELFLKARELDEPQREEFLRKACGDDAELLHEVTSLIQHDSNETIFTSVSQTPRLPLENVGRESGRTLQGVEEETNRILELLLGTAARKWLVVIFVFALLLVLALWTHRGMKQASEQIAKTELQTILNADVTALELWIEEKKKDVQLWASQRVIKDAVAELRDIAADGGDAPQLRQAPMLAQLKEELEDFDRIVGRPEQDAVIGPSGLVLAAGDEKLTGRTLSSDVVALLAPVFQGQPLFIKPQTDPEYDREDDDTPLLYMVAPIRRGEEQTSEIIAAGAFGFPADKEFTQILSVARKGETGETFAFDATGLLLNESRFDDRLRKAGLMPEDPTSRSILQVEVRDPGDDPAQWDASPLQAAERPLTVLAARAIAAGRRGSPAEQEGVILQPYRTYHGALVIGAWIWLPQYGMGVATEVEFDEQFAPMKYPLIAEWIRFAMLAGSVVTLLAAACWIVVLGRDAKEARKLGRYTLEEVIGKGGMGVVYRARHALLQRATAIKLLRPETINQDSMARFQREVQLASRLTHPNTIEIFDFGETPDQTFYCVMEFVDGRTLEQVVAEEGAMAPERAVWILTQIAGSLSEAHRHGIVHRDIKPSNVMLTEQGGIKDFVKVVDFGLARPIERSDGDTTKPGMVAGTPPYVAPERITNPLTVDARSDVYSFGGVAYYLLTGRQVFDADRDGGLARQILAAGPPLRPSEIAQQEIPTELDDLIARCLSPNVEDRATMQQIREQLHEMQSSAGTRPYAS